MEAPICAICQDSISDGTNYTIPECSHSFHTNCLMTWFRKGHNFCPLCKHPGVNGLARPPLLLRRAAMEQYKTVRRQSRRKTCPKQIKQAVKSLKKAEERLKQLKKDRKTFMASSQPKLTVRKIVSKARQFRSKIWSQERLVRRKKVAIGCLNEVIIIPVKKVVK